jgi:serine/threonine-protein kinase
MNTPDRIDPPSQPPPEPAESPGDSAAPAGLLWSTQIDERTIALPRKRSEWADGDTLRLGTSTGSEPPMRLGDGMPTLGRVGRYSLKLRLGAGGLGTVWAAHDPVLARVVAIKTLPLGVSADGRTRVTEHFLDEARAAAKLSHPHIVTVFDAGVGPEGAYIVMELLRGSDLSQLIKARWRPSPASAAVIMQRVADAIDYAHSHGVIHRDVKPANIFMVEHTRPVVLDFGIAHSGAGGTAEQAIMCSPFYAAPEQLAGDSADRRSDVYALGVVFYEVLTGERPYAGRSIEDIATALKAGKPRPITQLNPDVPPVLAAIAMRAMATDPEARFRSAGAMARALEAWIAAQSDTGPDTETLPPPAPPKANSGRRTWLLLTAATLAALLVAWLLRPAPELPSDGTLAATPAVAAASR